MKEQHALVAELVPFLLSRGYARNERAPSERELAVRFQTSRPQVREALSVLEAAAIGLPVVARNVPAMSGAPVGQWISSPDEAAEAVAQLSSGERWREIARLTTDVLRASLESTDIPGAIVAAYAFDRAYVGDAPVVPAI